MSENQRIFEPAAIGAIRLRNRFVRSATHEGMADADGAPTELLEELYVKLAKGQAGAVITGYAGVLQQGRSSFPGMLMMHDDKLVPAYRQLVNAVHQAGSPVIAQLAHCGPQTRSAVTGRRTVAPSALKDPFFTEEVPHELSESDIREIIEAFSGAAVRARASGFDGVQLHCAHGYLLAQFLSPLTNRRTDRWGGSVENRFRIVSEVMQSIRRKVGDFPVLAKINAYDGLKGGMKLEDAVQVAMMLEQAGCIAVEISSGTISEGLAVMRGPNMPLDPLFAANFKFASTPQLLRPLLKRVLPPFLPASPKPYRCYNVQSAKEIKSHVSMPVIVVGGIHTLEDATAALSGNRADFVSMSRPFIIEPSIVHKFREGKQSISKCTMCNYCAVMIEREPLRCWNGRLPAGRS